MCSSDLMVAMPHSTKGAPGVHGSTIGFMKVEKPVAFDEEDREKDAKLFFTLAATDGDLHMQNIERLMGVLTNEELVEELLLATTPEDLLALQAKYLD